MRTELAIVMGAAILASGCDKQEAAPAEATASGDTVPAAPAAAPDPGAPTEPAGARTTTPKELTAEAMKAGRPVQPSDWKPKVGDKVLSAFANSGSWSSIEIVKVDGDKFCSQTNYCKTIDKLLPFPKADAETEMPAVGAFVIAPNFSSAWAYAKVLKVEDKNVTVETVSYAPGTGPKPLEEKMIRPGEFILVK